jgi:hypothetical protein
MFVFAFVSFVLLVVASFVITLLPAHGENAKTER